MSTPDNSDRLAELIAARRAKLAQHRQDGEAFPNDFRPNSTAEELHQRYHDAADDSLSASPQCALAGRVMLRRIMGKASFLTLQDSTGSLQVYLRRDDIGEAAYAAFKNSDIGDWVGIGGNMMRTQKGELTLHAATFRLLVKALRPLPDKHHGLLDREAAGRKPYMALLLGNQQRVRARADMNALIRSFLQRNGYMEVETPMMHPIPGGANALPFITHHNSLNRDLYLRVAPEIYLKMLLVGGLDRIYELNRNFRNEGISSRHNPEFTMLEFYRSWADWHDGMAETEQLLNHLAGSITGGEILHVEDNTFDMSLPFARQSIVASVAEALQVDRAEVTDLASLQALGKKHRIDDQPPDPAEANAGSPSAAAAAPTRQRSWEIRPDDWGQLLLRIFEKKVEPELTQPVFITHFPLSVSPLARPCSQAAQEDGGDHELAERWELLIGGREIAGGFSELNDSEDQAERLRRQAERKQRGDQEAMYYDRQFITALEHGMPPATGVGIGLDRLLMLLTGATSVRDVLLFPQLRRATGED